jgi:DNA polymerase-4
MPSPAENALPTSDRRHTHTRGGSTGDGTSDLCRGEFAATSMISAGPRGGAPAASCRDLRLPPRTKRILHLDVDAFLASVEQAVHPELRGLPVVIGGMPTDRNLVMSCSYPARAFGVKPGMLLPEAHRRCPHAIFRRGDSQAAKRLRESVAHVLMRATPVVEISSIDDFFADLTGTTRAQGDAFEVAERARAAIARELALPVTIGIGTSRTLARIAGKLAKPGGVAEILPGCERAFLASLPIEHLPGAGKVIGRMLERFGITRVGEITLVPREILFASFGSMGLVLFERALGIDPTPVEATFTQDEHGAWIERLPKTIRRDSTFEPEEGRRDIVEAMFAYLVERATHVLRRHKAVARSVAVRVQYVDTRPKPTDRPREENPELETRVKLAEPTAATGVIQHRVLAAWRELPRRRALVKRVGITLADLTRSSVVQRTLFDDDGATEHAPRSETRTDRQRRLDDALDALRAKHGFGRILRGSSFPLKTNHELERDGFRLRTPSLNQ